MTKKNAFTLIELLVVISIIAILMAILMPALSKVRRQAKRSVCASNLHNWGLAITNYYSDNDHKIPSTRTTSGKKGGGVVPAAMLVFNVKGSPWEKQMSLEMMEPYLPGFDVDNQEMSPAWICPESQIDPKKVFDYYSQLQNLSPDQKRDYADTWFPMCYAYFARADQWSRYTTEPQELTRKIPESGKVLMSDNIYRWRVNGSWWFNHSKSGKSSVHQTRWGDNVITGVPDIAGANQLYGDGAVEWKPGSEFEPELMNECDEDLPQAFNISTSPSTNNDTTFW